MKKFSVKLLLVTIILTLFFLTIFDFYLWQSFRNYLYKEITIELAKKMSLAKSQIDLLNFEQKNQHELKQFADHIKKITDLRATIINKQGNVLADSDIPFQSLRELENHLNRKEVQEALSYGSGFTTRRSKTIQKDLLYYCETLTQNNRVIGFLRFAMFAPELKAKMSYFVNILARINIVIVIIALMSTWILGQWINHNLKPIKRQLSEQKDLNYFIPVPAQPYEEYNNVVHEINLVGEKLQQLYEELSSRSSQILNIINSMSEGVAAFNQQGYTVFYNNPFIEILKLKEDLVKNKPYYEWIHFPPLIQDIEKYLLNQKDVDTRTKYYGNIFIEYQILPLKMKSKDSGFILVIKDITQLQQLQTIRQDFVANVSHEFKTPLTSIRGYTETLLSGMVNQPRLQKKFLTKVIRQTEHLENMVTDLLQLSRIERKDIHKIVKINPIPIIKEFTEEIFPVVKKTKMTFKVSFSDGKKNVFILANQILIHTFLSNLVMNAIQYNKAKGKIWMRVKTTNKIIRIEVEDTGIGIPEKQKERIFERFYRLKEAKEIFAEGSGLGLSIVKHITELINGELGVESEPGKGSIFWVEIPLVKNT